jgi:hypothetical protein
MIKALVVLLCQGVSVLFYSDMKNAKDPLHNLLAVTFLNGIADPKWTLGHFYGMTHFWLERSERSEFRDQPQY